MVIEETDLAQLMDAGTRAVRFNSPLSESRAIEIAAFIGHHADTVVDLGCGAGSLAIELVVRQPHLRSVGIDRDAAAIERARAAAARLGLGDRVRFEVADLSEAGDGIGAVQPADAALCVGSSHALGGPGAALIAMGKLARSAAVIGEGMWTGTPTAEHRAMFGELPAGPDVLAELAATAGWTVVEHEHSSLEEWDEFELEWIAGVRSLGTPEAMAFADRRLRDYRSYRGVLGFGWLYLTR